MPTRIGKLEIEPLFAGSWMPSLTQGASDYSSYRLGFRKRRTRPSGNSNSAAGIEVADSTGT